MAAEGMQSHDQSCGNCPTASHPATKKGRINAPILPKPARGAKSDRLLAASIPSLPGGSVRGMCRVPPAHHGVAIVEHIARGKTDRARGDQKGDALGLGCLACYGGGPR